MNGTKVTPIAELDRQHGIPGVARVVAGQSGIPKVQVGTRTCSGEVYLHGAHVTSWAPARQGDVLFLSSASRFAEGKAIRGGVPICFPWFGNKADDSSAPSHGLLRTRAWSLDSVTQDDDSVIVNLSFVHSGDLLWPNAFRVSHHIAFGATLNMVLGVANTSPVPQRFEAAQHAYYRVGDVREIDIAGLDGAVYIDKTDAFRQKQQRGDIILTQETDRIYLNTETDLLIRDPALLRRIVVRKQNSRSTVVWNPWQDKAEGLGDLAPGEWPSFVCVETSNVDRYAIELAPGQSQTTASLVTVEPY